MAYRIEYGEEVPPKYQRSSDPRCRRSLTAVFLVLFALLVRLFFPAGALQLQQIFLPASSSVTQQALDTFMREVSDGVSLGNAWTSFCIRIIENDQTVFH